MEGAERRVLIAYDGSPTADTAVRAAASLFGGARAFVGTVPPDPTVQPATSMPLLQGMSATGTQQVLDALDAEARREAEETAKQAVEQAGTLGLEAEAVTIRPSVQAWAALLDTAHRLQADVLVCGTRGRGAFARAVLGSTSSSLLHNTDVPLLVVPDDSAALDGPVVAAYDGSEGARGAVETVGRLLSGRATIVVHAWEPTFHRGLESRALAAGRIDDLGGFVVQLHDALEDRAAATTEEGEAVAAAAGLDVVGETVEADHGLWRSVAAAARGHDASVIAMGSRGLGAARSVLLGSVSSRLVQHAELPVLVVPAKPVPDPAAGP